MKLNAASRPWRLRTPLLALTMSLAAPAGAGAAPPGETVVFQEDVVREAFSSVEDWPCMGVAGRDDDVAAVSGVETRHIIVTAAGIEEFTPLAPFTVRATEHAWVTIDPLAADLPTYSGFSSSVFRSRVGGQGEHTIANGLFKAVADDGSGTVTFRFRLHLVVDPHTGNLDEAERLLTDAIEQFRRMRGSLDAGFALLDLARVTQAQGRRPATFEHAFQVPRRDRIRPAAQDLDRQGAEVRAARAGVGRPGAPDQLTATARGAGARAARRTAAPPAPYP